MKPLSVRWICLIVLFFSEEPSPSIYLTKISAVTGSIGISDPSSSSISLSFLAALAIAMSTFLSFPVACLMTLTVFVCGSLSPYLSQSLESYFPVRTSDVDFGNIAFVIKWAFEHVVHAIASALVYCLDGFGSQRPTKQLVSGMFISWGTVLNGFITIGVIWSGVILVLGTTVLRKRQLAVYSGKG